MRVPVDRNLLPNIPSIVIFVLGLVPFTTPAQAGYPHIVCSSPDATVEVNQSIDDLRTPTLISVCTSERGGAFIRAVSTKSSNISTRNSPKVVGFGSP